MICINYVFVDTIFGLKVTTILVADMYMKDLGSSFLQQVKVYEYYVVCQS